MLALDNWRRLFRFHLPSTRLLVRALHAAGVLLGLLFSGGQGDASNARELQRAAAFELPQLPKVPGLPSLTGPSADWRQFDSFFTFVVKRFGDDVPANLRDSLGDAFLDTRYELTSVVAPGKGGNPVPERVFSFWLGRSALAAEPAASDLNQMLPDPKDLQRYLTAVRSLLVELSDKIATKSKLTDEHKPIYRLVGFTAAWQESC
jgi:hypothetical protein